MHPAKRADYEHQLIWFFLVCQAFVSRKDFHLEMRSNELRLLKRGTPKKTASHLVKTKSFLIDI